MIFVFGRDIEYGDFCDFRFNSRAELELWLLTEAQKFDEISIVEGKQLTFEVKVEISE